MTPPGTLRVVVTALWSFLSRATGATNWNWSIIFIKFDKFFLAKAARIPHHETNHHRGTIRVSVPGERQERGRLENRAWQ